ncbi:MAG: hypothetical protein COV91_06175 [Candidatus Taylorbacteria bacterium CG11_big_fil_rev_8_21_14_0_20_46_11]|uniref:Thioredoxin domain-containing protein n=1 Tax=Candidatus Taylorbacteria bacterium CG11_big_fil_rev_8_21_14_0_20_46_11 TaxID=1975025 RepID=A0A2H0K9V7_9BACT|nr:MAG: hypothetical protein COV91_06175 [Candidatus Taylorbacteria bacterium CG11_big_fil_rev_8_21_14_0_20_46_11]
MKDNNTKLKMSVGIVFSVAVVVLVGFLFIGGRSPYSAEALDSFASCLSEQGLTMYGAYWCPHCQNEKAEFGDSFAKVNYVECTDDPKQCTDAGITGYPTWIGPNGIRLEGEQGLQMLSEVSSCSLVQDEI